MSRSNKRNKRKTNKYHKNNSIDQMHAQQFGKCHYCDDYGHLEDTCPLVKKGVQDQLLQECKANYSKQPIRNQSENKKKADENLEEEPCDICESPYHNTIEHCTMEYVEEAHKVLMNLKDYCPFCKESGHDLYGCETFTKAQKEQQEYQQWLELHFDKENNIKGPKDKKTDDCYEKSFTYCLYCQEYGHNPYDCKLVNQPFNNKKDGPPFKKVYFPVNKKSVYLDSDKKFLRVCTVHCVCQMCHSKYSSKLNKKAVENNSTNTGSDDDAIRYCFICGANGLMDACLWKKTGSA